MPASPEAWRCFVAVPVAAAIRSVLEPAVAAWRAEPGAPDLRWSDPDGWHVTLAFLGPTDPNLVPGLEDALERAVRPVPPPRFVTGQLGAFPRAEAAQSIWLGLDDPSGVLGQLATMVQAAVLEPDRRRPLRAHLTIGRSRARHGEPLGGWLASRLVPTVEVAVNDVVLYRSHLGRGPARYEEVARIPVGGAGSARG
jgi:2'-5' RNA ligase